MKRNFVIVLSIALSSILFFSTSYAEMAKEGEGNYKAGMSWIPKVLPMEKERTEWQSEVFGVVVEAPENSPLFNASFYALGELHAIKGDYEEKGFVRYTRPDGDLVFMRYEAKGKFGGERKIKGTFVGGTGKCAGITGGGDFSRSRRIKASKRRGWCKRDRRKI